MCCVALCGFWNALSALERLSFSEAPWRFSAFARNAELRRARGDQEAAAQLALEEDTTEEVKAGWKGRRGLSYVVCLVVALFVLFGLLCLLVVCVCWFVCLFVMLFCLFVVCSCVLLVVGLFVPQIAESYRGSNF